MSMFGDLEESSIAGHYLSALINGDYSGLDEGECAEFEHWLKEAQAGRSGHWTYYREEATDKNGDPDEVERGKAGEHWRRCEVSGLMAMCETVVFCPLLKGNG